MSITSDPNHPGINKPRGDGQNEAYLVLSEEERAKGFVRPVRHKYVHTGQRPGHPLRDLTPEEKKRFEGLGYVKYEEYPKVEGSSLLGRFWTQKQLDSGCGVVTKMGQALAETWAAKPSFYGATFCCGCGIHLPVSEFTWDGTNEPVGS